MRLLFYKWDSFMIWGIERALQRLGITYDILYYPHSDRTCDDEFAEQVRIQLRQQVYDVVFSVNFVPQVSDACEERGIRYVSWVYDSPIWRHDISSFYNSCNEIYLFDRGHLEELRKKGVRGHHMLLAGDVESFAQGRRENPTSMPVYDVSMVGQLYETEYQKIGSLLSRHTQGYLEGILKAQEKVCEGFLIPDLASPQLVETINREIKEKNINFPVGKLELELLLAQETTGRERRTALTLLAKHFSVAVACRSKVDIEHVEELGMVHYYREMPTVFANSRINLNITLKAIRTGIPLRVMDILACGGFLLTNYQEEIAETFEIGKECEVYEGIEDLYYKTKFYLEHDDLRREIAQRGMERVQRDFTFEGQMAKMLRNS